MPLLCGRCDFLEVLALIVFGNYVGTQALNRIKRVSHRVDTVGIGSRKLVYQVENIGQIGLIFGYLTVVDLQAGKAAILRT